MVISDPQHTECSNPTEARRNICNVIMQTMCPPGYHHSGFVATHALGHELQKLKNSFKILFKCSHFLVFFTEIIRIQIFIEVSMIKYESQSKEDNVTKLKSI